MKKRLSVFFVLSLLLGCAGCGEAVPGGNCGRSELYGLTEIGTDLMKGSAGQ